MGFLTILLVAISLSFDSFAASVCCGLSMCPVHRNLKASFKIATSLAIFQAAMPVVGFYVGTIFKNELSQIDHWIAFALLFILGLRMIKEGRIPVKKRRVKNPTQWRILLPMSVATSIDALVIGIGFSLLIENILMPSLVIFATTLLVALLGIRMGRKLGSRLAGKAEIVGGLILIAIGTKILIDHLLLH